MTDLDIIKYLQTTLLAQSISIENLCARMDDLESEVDTLQEQINTLDRENLEKYN
jgi:outer membrane murein-binding lipoprotein Lpp